MLRDLIAEPVALLRQRYGGPPTEAAQRWCDRLESVVAQLMSAWRVTATGAPALAGYGGLALFVTRRDRTPAVLKVTFSREVSDAENEVLHAWAGRSAARLLERDDQQHARLLERLGGSLHGHPDPAVAMAIAGALTRRLAVTPPPGLPRMADLAPGIARSLAEASTSRVSGLTVRDLQAAAATFRDLGADQPETLLHGDLQSRNILRSERDGWAVIDPLGLVGDPALECLTILRDQWPGLLGADAPRSELRRSVTVFAEAADLPVDRVLAWTHARAVRAVLAGVTDGGLHAWLLDHLN